MRKAREEYKALKADPTAVRTAKIVPMNTPDTPAYDLQGRPVGSNARGVVVDGSGKRIVK